MKNIIPFLNNKKVITSAISWIIVLLTLFLSKNGLPQTQIIPLYIFGIVTGSIFFVKEAVEELFDKKIGIGILMSVGITAAAAIGEWEEALILVGLYSLAEAIESFITDKTRRAIEALMDLVPKHALVKKEGKEELVLAEKVAIGDIFIVKAGESIATDGVIRNGSASINQAAVTGESIPVFKKEGSHVFAGTLNENGFIEIEAITLFKDNTISKIIHMVEEAQESKGKKQQMIEKVAYTFSPIVLGISIAMPFIFLFLGFPLTDALNRAIAFVIAAAPCELAISVPIAFAAALGKSAKNGVLIKGGIYLEELEGTKVVAFDKTGTLTNGKPIITDVLPLNHLGYKELLQIVGGMAANSDHPLSRTISEEVKKVGVQNRSVTNFLTIAGEGVKGLIGKETVYLGNPLMFIKLGHKVETLKNFTQLSAQGKTVVFIGTKDKLFGLIALADSPRVEAKNTIDKLRQLSIQSVMLTGDHTLVGEYIGKSLGVDTVFAELKPDQKVEKIKELKEKFSHVVMVGDGINDAPALAESSVGMAMGTAGTDAAIEAADVAIMGDDLAKIPYAIRHSRFAMKIVQQNVFFSVAIQITAMFLAVFMILSISQILVLDEIGEVLVVLNGLRLLKSRT